MKHAEYSAKRAEAGICYGFSEEEKTDVGVRMLNPQARLQAAQWEKNNTVQIVTFISHKHTCKLGATGCTSSQKKSK